MNPNSDAHELPACCRKPAPFRWQRLGGAIVVILAAYLILQKAGVLGFSPTVGSVTSLAAIFAIGLAASVSSCTALVSGLLVALSASSATRHPGDSFRSRLRPHLLFGTGRLAGFLGFGAAIGWLGQAFSLSTAANGALVVAIAVLMLGLGLSLLEALPAHRLFPKTTAAFVARVGALAESPRPLVPFALGAASFFLPCGFTQAMQLYALSTGDPSHAALTMFVFALGTAPALFAVGAASSAAKGKGLARLSKAAGVLVSVMALSNFGNGAALLGWNPTPTPPHVPTALATLSNGEQIVQMEVTDYGTYAPDVIRVKKGIPVRWQVEGGKSMGCADTLVMRRFGIQETLRPGLNEISFVPTAPGRFGFSCAMGMVRGTMIVE
jgi:sulfite exporter TauE/SafE